MNVQQTIRKIKRLYNPECDVGSVDVTWAEMALLELVEIQQDRIEQLEARTLKGQEKIADVLGWTERTLGGLLEISQQQNQRIEQLEAQIARLMDAVPQMPKDDGSNKGRHKLFKT